MKRTARVTLACMIEGNRVVFLSHPNPKSWEPSILSFVGLPLNVTHQVGDEVFVVSPDGERLSFKAGELSDTRPDSAAVKAQYYRELEDSGQSPDEGAQPMSQLEMEAEKRLDDAVGDWTAFSRPDAKRLIVELTRRHPVLRMNSLRAMYGDLKRKGSVPPDFDQFLETPVKMWRGSNVTSDDPISVTLDPARTTIFGGGAHALMIRPSRVVYYIGGPEAEVFVPRGALRVRSSK